MSAAETAALFEALTNAAWRNLKDGITPDMVVTWADEQAAKGFGITADHTRCIAVIMESFIKDGTTHPIQLTPYEQETGRWQDIGKSYRSRLGPRCSITSRQIWKAPWF